MPSVKLSVVFVPITVFALAFVKYKFVPSAKFVVVLLPKATFACACISEFVISTLSAFTVMPYPAPTFSVTSPEVPPPVKPDPAVTLSISPAIPVKLLASP